MKHILVPVDLLSELAESLACELDARYPASVRSYESQDRKYQAEMEPVLTARQIIAAAPAVQGEPVITPEMIVAGANQVTIIDSAAECAEKVYRAMWAASTQPAEQQPDVAQLVEALRMLATAGHRLNNEAEECAYGDGMAEVAGSECWCEFRDALEAATEVLAAHRKQGGES